MKRITGFVGENWFLLSLWIMVILLSFCAGLAQAATNLPLGCPTHPNCGNSQRVFVVPIDGVTHVSTPAGWQVFSESLATVLVCINDLEPGTSTNECPPAAKIQVEYCAVFGALCIEPDDPPIEPPSPNHTVTLTWKRTAVNTDGSPLTDLAGYRIYSGTSKADGSAPRVDELGLIYTLADPNATMHKIPGFGWGRYYFSMSAYTSHSQESTRSPITADSTVEYVRPLTVPAGVTGVSASK